MPHSESVLPLGVPIAPTEPTDANSTHIAEYGRGGLHSVADITARTNISADRKRVGMLVYVQSESKYYTLTALPNTWAELSAAASIPDGSITTVQLGGDITSAGKALLDDATAADQRATLGLGTIATQDANVVAITGGSATGLSSVETDRIDFDKAAIVTPAQARMWWDAVYSTLSLGLDSDVDLKIGNGLYKLCRNNTGAPIAKGSVVYVNGSHGGTQLTVALASNSSEATSASTVGVAAETIADSASGFVQTFGYLEGVNTNGYAGAEGSALYLDSAAGAMRSGLPTQPAHGVRVGFLVKKAGAGAGSIFVNIQNYQEVEELSDVLVTSPASGHVLVWDATTGLWKNQQLSSASLAPNSVGTSEIKDKNVTFGKIQDIPTQTLVGRGTIGTGAAENIGLSSDLGIDPATFELYLTNRTGNSIIGRSASTAGAPADIAATADGQVLGRRSGAVGFGAPIAGGSATQVQVNVGGALSGFATFTYDSVSDRMTVGSIGLLSGEFIRNTVDGRIDLMPNPHPSGDFGIYFDLTSSNFYAKIGTIDSAGNLNTNSGIQFDNSLGIAASKAMDFGNTGGLIAYYAQSGGNGAWYFAPYIGTGNAGSVCLVSQNAQGVTNRRPSTAHTNPTLYVYAAGSANANDYARLSHNATDATLESGRGKLTIKGASAVRIESSTGGFDLPATAGSNGQVLTTDGTNASWQTPTGGGGGVSKAFAIAMAVAL